MVTESASPSMIACPAIGNPGGTSRPSTNTWSGASDRLSTARVIAQSVAPRILSEAMIVGGTAITGGLGGVGRTAVGALIISIVRIGMTFVGVNIFAENIVFGAVLVVAVAITIDRSKIDVIK